jgi:hypothetical protein
VIGPKQSRRQVNVDKDEGGIYKAQQPNGHRTGRGADTVPDDRHMFVDMPADYRKPNQVIHVLNVVAARCFFLFLLLLILHGCRMTFSLSLPIYNHEALCTSGLYYFVITCQGVMRHQDLVFKLILTTTSSFYLMFFLSNF